MTRGRATRTVFTAVASLLLLAVSAGCSLRAPDVQQQGLTQVFAVGDCVDVPNQSPANPTDLRAEKVPCSVDPSYTVGAMTDSSGTCPSNEYQHLPKQFASESTSSLCLVPNLVADHCYVLDMPVGMVQLADCAERGQQGLLVQVTQRLDVRDQAACPANAGQYAWPYPSPPRTYCTLTIF